MEETDIKAAARLRLSREKAGFASAAAAARANSWGEAAYRHHENGTRAIAIEQAVKYANAFKVSVSWLVFGPAERRESLRIPLSSFYVKVYADHLGEDHELWHLIDAMHTKLGLSMFPELSIDEHRIEWIVGANGLPPMHFIDPSEIDVDPSLVSEGYIFGYRVNRRFPQQRFSLGDLVLVDSSVEESGHKPAYYLFRDEAGPVIYMANSAPEETGVIVTTNKGTAAVPLSHLEPIDMLGRIVWIGQKA